MAVALEGFSIREYAAKMRSVDYRKCWPFDGDGRERGKVESTARPLPPIPIRKFRWWSDELEAARAELEVDAKPDFQEANLTRSSGKAKQRVPKKRSILELFAISPQVQTVDEDDDHNDEILVVAGDEEQQQEQEMKEQLMLEQDLEAGGRHGGGDRIEETAVAPDATRKRKRRIIAGSKKEMMSKKICMRYKKHNSKKKKKRPKVEICAAKKEKDHIPKMPYVAVSSQLLQGSVHKQPGKILYNSIDARKRKPPPVKNLSKKNSFRQTSKLISKNQEEAANILPVHSILKNRTKAFSAKMTNLNGDNQIKPHFELEKHVTFSAKDNILGDRRNQIPMELPQSLSTCKIFSSVLAVSSSIKDLINGEKLPPPAEETQVVQEGAKGVAIYVSDSTAIFSSEKEQSKDAHFHATFPIALSNRNCPSTERMSMGRIIDLNCATESDSNLNCVNPGISASSPRHSSSGSSQILNSACREEPSSDTGLQTVESFMCTSNARNLPAPMGSCVSNSDATSTPMINRNLVSDPLASHLLTSMQANNSRLHLQIQPKLDAFRYSPEYRPVSSISAKDLISSIGSLVGTKKKGDLRPLPDPLSVSRDKYSAEGFIGLPLNSQGELIKSQSKRKLGSSDHFMQENLLLDSGNSSPFTSRSNPKNITGHEKLKEKFPDTWNDQLKWFPDLASKSAVYGLGAYGLQELETESVRNKDRIVHEDPYPMRTSCHGYKEYTQTHNWIDRERFQEVGNLDNRIQLANQRTMRLMGKDVTVGKSSKQFSGFNDSNIWTDKEIIPEQCPDMSLTNQWPQQEQVAHTACGTSRENYLHSLEALSSHYHIPEVERQYDNKSFDRQGQWISSNGPSSTFGNHGSEVSRSIHTLPSNALLSKTSKSSINCNSIVELESSELRHHIPVAASRTQNVGQQFLLGSAHCTHNQSPPYNTSDFLPSFQNHVNGSFLESSSHTSSYLPKWLLNSKQLKKNQKTWCPSTADPPAIRHPCIMPGTNLHPLSPRHPTSIVTPLFHNSTSNTRGSFTKTSLVHPSFALSCPTSKYIPVVSPTYKDKIKNKDGRETNYTYFKLLDRVNTMKKRPSDRENELMRQVKRRNLTVHGHSNAASRSRQREKFIGCAPCSTGYSNAPSCENNARGVGFAILNNEKNALRTGSGCSCLKFDGGSKSGPVKLSAGAKHILKPGQNTDQDNCRRTHSTIPFVHGDRSEKLPISQKKVAEIYRF